MSKKQKRQVVSAAPVKVVEAGTPSRTRSGSSEFNPDYTPVVQDLKKIGILAVSFIGVLVILSFIIK